MIRSSILEPTYMHIYCSLFAQLFAELIGAFLAGIFSLYLSSTWTMEAQLGTQLSFGIWQGKSTSISIHSLLYRRKFRRQTSDNMDRWKAEMGRVREKRRVEERRSEKRKSQKKETADARKGRKVAKHCVFAMMCGSGGSKSRLSKAAGAEPSGQMRDEKLHVVVARSTFRSQHVQSTPGPDQFWKLRCRKSARRCGAKRISKWTRTTKHTRFGPLLEVAMSKKCTELWREARFEAKMYKTHHIRTTFEGSDVVLRGRRRGFCTLPEVSKAWEFYSNFKNVGRRGAFVGDLQRWNSRGRCGSKDMFIRDVRRSGRWFPERVCILEHQSFRFAEMILRGKRSTSYDLASIFRGRRSTLDRWSGKIAKRICTRPSALHSTFHSWRKSRRIAWFLMLSSSKIEEVSQNCFVLDVVKFKNEEVSQNSFVFHVVNFEKWGSLAELLRFWCCQLWKMRKSRRTAAFLMLSSSKQLGFQACRSTGR